MPAATKARLDALRETLAEHAHRYYVLDAPIVSDAEYDVLFKELLRLEQAHPDWVTKTSPSQRIGAQTNSQLPQVRRTHPMLSLGNIFDAEELDEFDARVRRHLGSAPEDKLGYAVEPKVDGLSIELTYTDGVLTQASTRGDGTTGEDVTPNARTIKAIPLVLRQAVSGVLIVRGEVYLPKDLFAGLNRDREEAGMAPFANPRNAAAGSLRQLDPRITAQRPLRAVFYSLATIPLGPDRPKTHMALVAWLSELGLPVLPARFAEGPTAVQAGYDAFLSGRHNFVYELDGVVIKVDDHRLQDELGQISRAPRWAIAYKMPPQQATTQVEDIVVQVGRTGALTPVAQLKPVGVGGVIVSRATLHNADEVARKDVRCGDTVFVQRAGDVIPEITQVVLERRPKTSVAFVFPTHCPVCATQAVRPEDEAVWRCPNRACPAQVHERLRHYTSRKAMDIRGLGERMVAELVATGEVLTPADLYTLTRTQLLELPRRKDKSVDSLLLAIETAKQRPLARAIFALGIRRVGEHVARILAQQAKTLSAFAELDAEALSHVHGIGPEVALALGQWLSDPDNKALVRALVQAGVSPPDKAVDEGSEPVLQRLIGKTLVVTGTLDKLTRDEAHSLILEHGGRAASSVSKKTDFVVAGREAGSKLRKAQELGVAVLDEAAFLEMLQAP